MHHFIINYMPPRQSQPRAGASAQAKPSISPHSAKLRSEKITGIAKAAPNRQTQQRQPGQRFGSQTPTVPSIQETPFAFPICPLSPSPFPHNVVQAAAAPEAPVMRVFHVMLKGALPLLLLQSALPFIRILLQDWMTLCSTTASRSTLPRQALFSR